MRFAEQVEAAAYFFVSEALANVIKHARASSVRLELAADGGRLRVAVHDDGVGIRDGATGSGLFGLADRLDALGGTLTINNDRGTCLAAELPLRERARA